MENALDYEGISSMKDDWIRCHTSEEPPSTMMT